MKKIMVDVQNPDWEVIREAVTVLKRGGIVALPTETVYGLAAINNDEKAINRLYDIKKRPKEKPFTLCVAESDVAIKNFTIMPPFAYRMMEDFWPGPLTMIFYSYSSDHKIGIRVPAHDITNTILREINSPVCLSSANISGQKDVVSADEVENIFGDSIDLIIDAGEPQFLEPSTVIDLTQHPFEVLREGAIASQDLMVTFFRKRIVFVCTGNTCRSPMAEYILKKILAEQFPYLLERYEVISRGIIQLGSQMANSNAKRALSEIGSINADAHRSKMIDKQTILSSDLIIVMEEAHKDYIVKIEPTAESRVFSLRKFLTEDSEVDIIDPINKSYEVYVQVFERIREGVKELLGWLS